MATQCGNRSPRVGASRTPLLTPTAKRTRSERAEGRERHVEREHDIAIEDTAARERERSTGTYCNTRHVNTTRVRTRVLGHVYTSVHVYVYVYVY